MHLELLSLVVDDYDEVISSFVEVLGFDLIEDSRHGPRTAAIPSGGSWSGRVVQ